MNCTTTQYLALNIGSLPASYEPLRIFMAHVHSLQHNTRSVHRVRFQEAAIQLGLLRVLPHSVPSFASLCRTLVVPRRALSRKNVITVMDMDMIPISSATFRQALPPPAPFRSR
jgi:hypothetical protein|eukprot:COSAG01_NODE_7099_length_3354_cov_2.238710_2_plen_114_part_00